MAFFSSFSSFSCADGRVTNTVLCAGGRVTNTLGTRVGEAGFAAEGCDLWSSMCREVGARRWADVDDDDATAATIVTITSFI